MQTTSPEMRLGAKLIDCCKALTFKAQIPTWPISTKTFSRFSSRAFFIIRSLSLSRCSLCCDLGGGEASNTKSSAQVRPHRFHIQFHCF